MAEAIADTSALQYLHQVGLLSTLPSLGSTILVPSAVAAEVQEGIRLGKNMPDLAAFEWLKLADPSKSPALPRQDDLGAGEAAVLRLALERPGSVAILDDKVARQAARALGLPHVGVLGILLQM